MKSWEKRVDLRIFVLRRLAFEEKGWWRRRKRERRRGNLEEAMNVCPGFAAHSNFYGLR